ncbi:methyltransferase family protein [Nocardioides terrigena]|uniref:methyltransferase family protein n=1 Tax=Nocardioides terrigena TaxID=424797 RepID=UPI000D30FCDC|nr:isoprenylcysteine carboxylmethyltransferase family protein [Nocardioides terrigena]
MTVAALAIYAIYLGVAFGVRTWVQWRRTGDTGFRGLSGRPFSAEWWAGALFAAALAAGLLGPVLALAGLPLVGPLDHQFVAVAGLVVATVGVGATFVTQLDMGTSWRIGVDAEERTELVTGGTFRHVRNPIFTAMAVTGLGLTMMVPNVITLLGAVLLLVALELQVRVVEEPYLRSMHGASYADYAAGVGRFLPGVGRLEPPVVGVPHTPNNR